jgi:hypothetical protein
MGDFMDQISLSKIFISAEKIRAAEQIPVRWGSNRHGDKDSLWDIETNTQWERDHPDGEWYVVPYLGKDTYA